MHIDGGSSPPADSMAERLRRVIRNHMGYARVGSNPTAVVRRIYIYDTLAEWLRRRPAKPLGSARAGSNPAGVVDYIIFPRPGFEPGSSGWKPDILTN